VVVAVLLSRTVPDDVADRPRRRPGRPREPVTSCSLTTWVPESVFDALVRAASRRNESVSALTRKVLPRAVTPRRDEGA